MARIDGPITPEQARRPSRGASIVAVGLVMALVFAAALLGPFAGPGSLHDPRIAWGVSIASAVGCLILAVAFSWSVARIRRRGRRTRLAGPASAIADGDGDPDGLAGMPTVTFRTQGARRRFVPLASAAGELRFAIPLGQARTPSVATVRVAALPETVSCGTGYLEVLWATGDGFVMNEVRTSGDDVTVIALPEPAAPAEETAPGAVSPLG